MATVLLVFPDVECGYGVPKYPPLGLAYLASALEKSGVGVSIIDERETGEDYYRTYEGIKPTHIGFYASVLTKEKVKKYLKFLKGSSIKTIVGGPHASIEPEEFRDADKVIVGEGEISICSFVNGTNENPPTGLDSIPFPAWHLFGDKFKSLPVMTTRGCPYNCIFCGVKKIFGQQYRKRSVHNIIAEIKRNVEEFGMKHFEIIDDNFTLDKEFVKDFCNSLIDYTVDNQVYDLSWDCVQGVRIDALDEEAFGLMAGSGCRMIGIGVESGNQEVVDNIGKAMRLDVVEEKIKFAKTAGLTVKAFFVVGAPGDTFEKTKKSVEFFKRCKIDIPRFGMLAPYEGTDLREWIKENATLLADEFTHGLEHKDVVIPFETPEFSKEDRLKAYELVTRESEIWTIRMRFGWLAGLVARPTIIRRMLKKIYYDSNWLKQNIWN